MALTRKNKALVIAAVVGSLVTATATFASATPQGQEILREIATWGGGAVDLNGNPVDSKTFVGDELPSDLGELQFEGTATP